MTQPDGYQASDTKSKRLHNFSAGPAVLPEDVLHQLHNEVPVYKDIGVSILEVSHRSQIYTKIAEDARALLRKLLHLSDDWHVLFLQGGASMQFYQVPLNFLPKDGTADYLITGSWAKKALKEALFVGKARVVASSDDRAFTYIPDPATWDLDPDAAYLHFTSNNTIYGTGFHFSPEVDVPLVCDASSDFLSRPIEMDRYGLIYAGAQKNVGPAGVTIVLVKDDFLQGRNQPLPTLLDYGTHTAKLFHTPPVFAVYMVEKILRWLDELGGLEEMARINDVKAAQLYGCIDRTDFYQGIAQRDSRSKMNVTFRLPTVELDAQFIAEAKEQGLLALTGYRVVGGIRASIYNACALASVEALVTFMDDFERKSG